MIGIFADEASRRQYLGRDHVARGLDSAAQYGLTCGQLYVQTCVINSCQPFGYHTIVYLFVLKMCLSLNSGQPRASTGSHIVGRKKLLHTSLNQTIYEVSLMKSIVSVDTGCESSNSTYGMRRWFDPRWGAIFVQCMESVSTQYCEKFG